MTHEGKKSYFYPFLFPFVIEYDHLRGEPVPTKIVSIETLLFVNDVVVAQDYL